MAGKYSFLSSWGSNFLTLLNSLVISDNYISSVPARAASGRVYQDSVKSRDLLISKILQTRPQLLNLFVLNKTPDSEYNPILTGLDALLGKLDLTNSKNVLKIIDYYNKSIKPLI